MKPPLKGAFLFTMDSQKLVLAIDPGREKIGIAILDFKGNVLSRTILTFSEFISWYDKISSKYKFSEIAVGDGTGKEKIIDFLERKGTSYMLVNEKGSSEEARKLYFLENPPRGWRKFIPLSLLSPEKSFDDWQAVVIGRRFLKLFQRR